MAESTYTAMSMAALEAAFAANVPTMLVGPPGIGKTAVIRALAKKGGYDLVTLIGNRLDPTDINGMPKGEVIYEREEGTEKVPVYGTVFLSPEFQHRIMRKKKVILFLDEFSNTPASVRASLLTLIQNREFANGEKMPAETVIIGAMNPPEEAADGYDLDLPTSNRIFFISWKPSVEEWVDGMKTAWGEDVPKEELEWKGKIARFISDNPSYLHKQPEQGGTAEVYTGFNSSNPSDMAVINYAWPSRRSWDNLSKMLANGSDDHSIQDFIGAGVVGPAAMGQFRDWLRKNERIDPKAVLAKPEDVKWDAMSVDDAHLVLRAIIEMLTDKNALQVLHVFDVIADQGADNLGAAYLDSYISAGYANKHKQETLAVLKKYRQATRRAQ